VLPGFINVHSHSGIIRGLAEDLPVFEWLEKYVDPVYETLRPEEAKSAYELCLAENIRAGVTCTLDMWHRIPEAVSVAKAYGMRAVLVPYVSDQHENFHSLEDNRELVTTHNRPDDKLSVWFGLEHLSYCDKETFVEAAQQAEKHDVGVHTHVCEAKPMVEEITEEYSKSPVELLDQWDFLGSNALLAHCVWLTESDIGILSETNSRVAHCPTSNAKLGSGTAPIVDLVQQGVPVGLGSDGIKANNRIDIIQEMKTAGLLQKVHNLDPTLMTAEKLLRMATIEAAEALGMEDRIGSLEPGKQADIILIDHDKLHMSPVVEEGEYSNLLPNIVYALYGSDVETVISGGELLLRNGEFTRIDTGNVTARHKQVSEDILQRIDI